MHSVEILTICAGMLVLVLGLCSREELLAIRATNPGASPPTSPSCRSWCAGRRLFDTLARVTNALIVR